VSGKLRYLLIAGCAVAAILLFLLASAAENSVAFDQHYPWLLGLNVLVAVALLGLVIWLLARLYQRHKQKRFGSRLMTRLVLLFAVTGVLPGTVIYLVSVQFVSRSIESWFDVRVESALESGLNLSRSALDTSLADLSGKARSIAAELADVADINQINQLSRLRDQSPQLQATVLTGNGRLLANIGGRIGELVPDLPNSAMLRQARTTRGFAAIEGGTDAAERRPSDEPGVPATVETPGTLRLRAVVAIPSSASGMSLAGELRFLQLLQPVPAQLATNAEALRAAYGEYQERSLARSGLRKMYLITLSLTLLLSVFGAIVSAFLIATDLAQPLLLLAEGSIAVAEGNFSPRPIVATRDELGTLTQSFNAMTKQLFDARSAVERNRAELENAKAYLESVLANMSAGVLVFDSHFKLVTCNESVERILQRDFDTYIGQPLSAIPGLDAFALAITNAFSGQNAQSAAGNAGPQHWQQQIEIPRTSLQGQPAPAEELFEVDQENALTLLARGSQLPITDGLGYVVVFDDISDVISAQRSIAWGEVARRLAHEIKNPLTPIQLSAERMQMKLASKLDERDAAMLNRSTTTIVNQVSAMKRMVDDFRDYAKTPPAVLAPLALNPLIEEILTLYTGGEERGVIRANLSPALPVIMGDATQLRQVIHNLLQNAQDAIGERAEGAPAPRIDVTTDALNYRNADGAVSTAVRLQIIDNGIGFAPKILTRAFEPYVTSKPRGTGLGLPMVKKIIDEHGGRIDIQNRADDNGAKIAILLLKLAPELV
jgi:nitrogen fixation/metabolism regulation signal transduction histidine kinase